MRRGRVCLLAGLATLALAGSLPGTAVGQAGCTPNKQTEAADPGITRVGTAYKLLSTSGVPGGLRIRSSTNGDNWCPTAERVFARPPGWIRRVKGKPVGGFWAPKLYTRPAGGPAIVVYAALRNARRRCIGLAVAEGATYRDRGPVVCKGGNRYIDPELFFDPIGGGAYLLYKEDPDLERHPGRVKRIMIRSIDLASVDGRGAVRLGGAHPILSRPRGWEGRSVEAPTMIHQAGRYYLFYSGGNFTTRGYGVGVARSDKLTGPFERFRGNPIVGGRKGSGRRCGVGHQDVTQVGSEQRIYSHYYRRKSCAKQSRKGEPRFLEYRRLTWRNGWPRPSSANAAAATTGPAAAKTCVGHPSDASIACVRNGGRTLDVCDRGRDGHRAYARVVTEASSPRFQSPFYDTNGSKAGCANLPFTSRIVSVAVCVQHEGCSAFKPTGVAAAPTAPQAPAPPPPRPPAQDVCAAHPSDPSVVCVRNSGHTVDVCDRDPDGHRAYARVVTEASNPGVLSPFYDGNDSQAGCANVPFPSRVLSVAVCVQYEGCSALKPT